MEGYECLEMGLRNEFFMNTTYTVLDGDYTPCPGVEIIHTPGHTPGSVTLAIGDNLFTGDTLFCGSCGRTDFPGSSPKDMMVSLCCLAVIEGNYNVYPGHDRITTLDFERKNNPFMRYAMEKFGRK